MPDLTRREFVIATTSALLGTRMRLPEPVVSSWFDRGLPDQLAAYARQPGAGLVVGTWGSSDRRLTHTGDVDFGSAAALQDSSGDGVRIFVMGGGSGRKNRQGRMQHGGAWRGERAWPIADARETLYYLHRSGVLSPSRATEDFTWDEYAFDPRDPVPTIGAGGPHDQRHNGKPLTSRPDVLVFQTPPLEQGVEVTGGISAKLWIESDSPDTDFTIKLIDVYPPSAPYPGGFAMNLTDGIASVRNRASRERPTLMTAGRVYEITVVASPTSNWFAPGHRIRLDVSSSNAPRYSVNPNTGAPAGSRAPRVATNRVYLDRARPSQIVLPVVSRGRR